MPTAHYVPAAPAHQALDASEQGGFIFLDPAVEDGFVMVKNKTGELIAEIGGRAESADGLRRSLLPFPEPDWVEVRVADQMNGGNECRRLDVPFVVKIERWFPIQSRCASRS